MVVIAVERVVESIAVVVVAVDSVDVVLAGSVINSVVEVRVVSSSVVKSI